MSQIPVPLYQVSENHNFSTPREKYEKILSANRTKVSELIIKPRTGESWTVAKGRICRISLPEGPQVCDLNLWNSHDPKERFWASRTKQLQSAHMNPFDHFWSCLPFLRKMATLIDESLHYGLDEFGGGCHDLLGTRCDATVHKMLTGETLECCCHENLTQAVASRGLSPFDVHDVVNVFQLTGLTKKEDSYYVRPCPAKKGDYFEFYAEIDLLCAASACPHGDMSKPIWGPGAVDASEICRPLQVEVFSI